MSADTMDVNQVMQLLAHRYPFLLIDRVLEVEDGKRLLALKNVSYNEPYFQGHFPVRPIMPGVLIVEALAQATGLLAMRTDPSTATGDSLYYFAGIDNARFKRVVEPGDQLRLEVVLNGQKRGIWKFSGVATVDGEVAAKADIMCTSRKVEPESK